MVSYISLDLNTIWINDAFCHFLWVLLKVDSSGLTPWTCFAASKKDAPLWEWYMSPIFHLQFYLHLNLHQLSWECVDDTVQLMLCTQLKTAQQNWSCRRVHYLFFLSPRFLKDHVWSSQKAGFRFVYSDPYLGQIWHTVVAKWANIEVR